MEINEQLIEELKLNPSLIEKYGLGNNREVLLEIVQYDGSAFKYASEELRSDRDFVLKIVYAENNPTDFDDFKCDCSSFIDSVNFNASCCGLFPCLNPYICTGAGVRLGMLIIYNIIN